MIKKDSRHQMKDRRHCRSRKKLSGTTRRPRLAVFRSEKQIYVQIIDDTLSTTLASASSLEKSLKIEGKAAAPKKAAKTEAAKAEKGEKAKEKAEKPEAKSQEEAGRPVLVAKAVGKLAAERAIQKGISEVVFDRGGFRYHGRIRALAEGAREAGLKF